MKVLVWSALLVSTLPAAEQRIVTVGAIASELVCTLGACEKIVGTDVTSVYPPELRRKPKVGYITRLSSEGILSLKPTHLVMVEGAGPRQVLEQLQKMGVGIITLPTGLGLADAEKRLLLVGEFLGNKKMAQQLASKLRQEIMQLSAHRHKKVARVLFIYARGAQTLLAMGKNTTADELIHLAGAENAFNTDGAKPVSAEAVVQAAPDIVLLPEGSLAGLGGIEGLKKIPGLAQTPAGKNLRVVTLEDTLLAGLGPRSPTAVRTLREKIQNTGKESP
ncbi:MAG: ABC transporter substrate-binding protein [Turneriella sp.]|nr:ABC transporter substrate-binding protein [Turneriella sp.]